MHRFTSVQHFATFLPSLYYLSFKFIFTSSYFQAYFLQTRIFTYLTTISTIMKCETFNVDVNTESVLEFFSIILLTSFQAFLLRSQIQSRIVFCISLLCLFILLYSVSPLSFSNDTDIFKSISQLCYRVFPHLVLSDVSSRLDLGYTS